MSRSFKTQNGLKIRLDLSYFMGIITGIEKDYEAEELFSEQKICSIVTMSEARYCVPDMLKWYFTFIVLLLLPDMSVAQYALITSGLYAFGMIWRVIVPDIIINLILTWLDFVYEIIEKFWLIPYLTLLIFGIIKNKEILIAFFILSALLWGISELFNKFIVNHSFKKYGHPFNDTEYCAFITAYVFLMRREKLSEFIKDYCTYIDNKKTK